MLFCRRCGKQLENDNNHIYRCANGHMIYANNSPTVSVFFISPDNQKVLLANRVIEPHKGMLTVPGGFLDAGESFEEGAMRELNEELDLKDDDYGPLTYLTSTHDAYPYQNEIIPIVNVLFWSRLKSSKTLHPSDDITNANWHRLADIDFSALHADDIRTGIHALQKMFNKEKN